MLEGGTQLINVEPRSAVLIELVEGRCQRKHAHCYALRTPKELAFTERGPALFDDLLLGGRR